MMNSKAIIISGGREYLLDQKILTSLIERGNVDSGGVGEGPSPTKNALIFLIFEKKSRT
jgi:hypothetical protein